ncbi:MAG: hypothetical protein RLZZ126_1926 [Pseudomonadota bacterium]|jgi:3-oxoadipate enol-lactonase
MSMLPHHVSYGSGGTTVFLLHGVGGSHQSWDATLPVLAGAGYKVVAWDAPGYGQSVATGPLSMQVFAQMALGLIASVGTERNVIVGHSMGGMIAQEAMALNAALRGPSVGVHGLVLFATSAAFGKPGGDWQKQFLQSRFAALDAGLGMEGLAKVLVGGMLALSTPDSVRDRAMQTMVQVSEQTYRQALAAIVSFNRLHHLPSIAVPTLCLACHQDKTAPPDMMEKMASLIPGGRYECIAQAGHLGNLEQPEAFHAALLKFLRQHFPT